MKRIFTLTILLAALAVSSFAQADPTLLAAQTKFIKAVETKNTVVFLSFISKTDGLRIMNTIDQGELGANVKPVHEATLTHAALKKDFAKRGDHYKDIFVTSEVGPNFYDWFAKRKEKWTWHEGDKFMPFDRAEGKPLYVVYLKWKKEGTAWKVVEAARMIS